MAAAQRIACHARRLTDSERLPAGRVWQVGIDRVDVVRVVDHLPLCVVERDVEVLGVDQLADDLVDGRVERRHVLGRAGRLGDAVQRRVQRRVPGVIGQPERCGQVLATSSVRGHRSGA